MIAVDTNILVYAHRAESEWFPASSAIMKQLAESAEPWAIPWPCVHEFLVIVTHPRVYSPPTPLGGAMDQIEAWLEPPSLVLLAETEGYWPKFRSALEQGRITGPQIHNARVAAICRDHGVRELWTSDRDFSCFTAVTVVNPLVG